MSFIFSILMGSLVLHPILGTYDDDVQIKRPALLTFDNLPVHSSACLTGVEKRQRLLQTLESENIESVFFVVGEELFKNSTGFPTLEAINKAGHRIANHSYTHPHLSEMNSSRYIVDIESCNALIKTCSNYRPWFRYPFLDIGLEGSGTVDLKVQKLVETAQALINLGYFHAYVSVDSYDWFLNTLLLRAIADGKAVDQERLEHFYLEHLKRTIPYYTRLRDNKNNLNPYVFLFHSNADITVLCLPKIIQMLRDDGWYFISPEEAFDPEKNSQANFSSLIIEGKAILDDGNAAVRGGDMQVIEQTYLNDPKIATGSFQKLVLDNEKDD